MTRAGAKDHSERQEASMAGHSGRFLSMTERPVRPETVLGLEGGPRRPVILFDGDCLFCLASVRFVSRRDPGRQLIIAEARSPAGQALLRRHGLNGVERRTVVFLEGSSAYMQSTAALRIMRYLEPPWNRASIMLLVPRPVRDAV
jgi:predicted DCC family thiol-disulfide oxidoreductase YuxK